MCRCTKKRAGSTSSCRLTVARRSSPRLAALVAAAALRFVAVLDAGRCSGAVGARRASVRCALPYSLVAAPPTRPRSPPGRSRASPRTVRAARPSASLRTPKRIPAQLRQLQRQCLDVECRMIAGGIPAGLLEQPIQCPGHPFLQGRVSIRNAPVRPATPCRYYIGSQHAHRFHAANCAHADGMPTLIPASAPAPPPANAASPRLLPTIAIARPSAYRPRCRRWAM